MIQPAAPRTIGPDVASEDYVAWQCDQDAYALSGQKCSAQSMLFAHKNWMDAGIVDKMADRAAMRKLSDLTHSPVLTWSNADIAAHQEAVLKIPGSKLLFGGKPLEEEHSIPDCYGSYEATAVFVPIEEASKPENFEVVTHELFGPFQVVTEYDDSQLDLVLEMCERMENHLTAAIVSNDPKFGQKVLGSTINGTCRAPAFLLPFFFLLGIYISFAPARSLSPFIHILLYYVLLYCILFFHVPNFIFVWGSIICYFSKCIEIP